MMFWTILAAMTALALLAALWPLLRAGRPAVAGDDVAVYRDQLDEIERDLASGRVAPAEAEAARIEVSRRLIAAAEAAPIAAPRPGARANRMMAAVVATALPLAAIGFYLVTGSPELPGQPLAERMARQRAVETARAVENQSFAALVARAEAHLRDNPDDARGWTVLAPALFRLERYADAATAYRNVIRLSGETVDRLARLGESLVAAADDKVTPEAKAVFERILVLDPGDASAAFHLGAAAEQAGEVAEARRIWSDLLARTPADAPWRESLRKAIRAVGGDPDSVAARTAPGAGVTLSADQRAMVLGMVEGLATKLREDGSDPEAWVRLMRSYIVLGDRDRAVAALADARRALAAEPGGLRRIADAARELGLDGVREGAAREGATR